MPAPPSAASPRRLGEWVRHLGAFGVVGAASLLLDMAAFQLLYAHLGVGAVTAKLLATVLSMTSAYIGHRYWSFSHRRGSGIPRQYMGFLLINGVTLVLNLGVVAFVRYPLEQTGPLVLQLANVAGIGIGTIARYLAYRRWIFPAAVPEPTAGEVDLTSQR